MAGVVAANVAVVRVDSELVRTVAVACPVARVGEASSGITAHVAPFGEQTSSDITLVSINR